MTKKIIIILITIFALPLWAATNQQKGEPTMFEAIKLPYDANFFEPKISAETFSFHYGKHYKAYLDNLNKIMKEKEIKADSLEEVIQTSYQKPELVALFNNAAQVYNHEFYFNNLKPISDDLKLRIEKEFGSVENFKKEWKVASLAQFGSGWVWLIEKDGLLDIIKTSNAETPIAHGDVPLMTIDVWEHAYYLDYQNMRATYVDAFLDIVL